MIVKKVLFWDDRVEGGDEIYKCIKKYLPYALNVGGDVNNFEPVTFEELKENCDVWYGRNE
ncbi:MAG: hypothetical protein J6A75_09645 [Lachnospiraceae bacterium]|nr:hypothetical protein [Lachnospiraceae bacterium]